MPTNDERREVAEGLREEGEVSGCLIAAALKVMCCDFKTCVECGEYCANRLADLIEPEPERTCHAQNLGGKPYSIPILLCDSCGAFNYAKADGSTWNYCPNCGAKVMGE